MARGEAARAATETQACTARATELRAQIESTGLAAHFAAQPRTSGRVPAALDAYWRLRAMRFDDALSREAVVQHLDDQVRQVEYVLSRAH